MFDTYLFSSLSGGSSENKNTRPQFRHAALPLAKNVSGLGSLITSVALQPQSGHGGPHLPFGIDLSEIKCYSRSGPANFPDRFHF